MRTPARMTVTYRLVVVMALCVFIGLGSGRAWAGTSVTIPAGDPHNEQTITVTGTGFPSHAKYPTGMQILECSDPGGTAANLPTSNLFCDGSTINPSQINQDAQGSFSAKYTVYSLNSTHTSNISCDKTHYCVLWVGVDYNQDFFGPHAFSTAFEVGGAATAGGSGSSSMIWIVVLVVLVVVALGAALVVVRSRRRQPTRTSSDLS